jgi:hypothetical protein
VWGTSCVLRTESQKTCGELAAAPKAAAGVLDLVYLNRTSCPASVLMCSAFIIAVHAQYNRLQAAMSLEYARTRNAAAKIRELSCGAWLVLGTAGSSMVRRLCCDWPKAPTTLELSHGSSSGSALLRHHQSNILHGSLRASFVLVLHRHWRLMELADAEIHPNHPHRWRYCDGSSFRQCPQIMFQVMSFALLGQDLEVWLNRCCWDRSVVLRSVTSSANSYKHRRSIQKRPTKIG